MARTVFDCARVPGDTCSLQMTGDEGEVLPAAQQHLVAAHGYQQGEQLQQNVSHALNEPVKPYDGWI
jgi:predicted small metal-binding protein